jgi:hypothetical protein
MSRRLLSHEIHVHAWLGASELSAHWAGYVRHLLDQGYRKSTVLPYRAAVAHFGHWMTVHSVRLRNLPLCHRSCRLDRTVILGLRKMKWLDTDKHSKIVR